MIRIAAATLARPSSILSEVAVPYDRCFSSCPFQVLGFDRKRRARPNPAHRVEHDAITFEQVQTAFRELALKHHPDVRLSSAGGNNSSNEFARIREAFEAIVEGPDGMAVLRDDDYSNVHEQQGANEMNVPNDNYDRDRHHDLQNARNGFLHASVNPRVFQELADVAEKMNPGGLDRGGMWQYADMIRGMAGANGEGLPPLRVGEGDGASERRKEAGKRARRRRKRK